MKLKAANQESTERQLELSKEKAKTEQYIKKDNYII